MISKIEAWLIGKKVYVLMALGALVAVSQYALGFNLGVETLPPATDIGDLVSQLWAFAVASGFRAAIAKTAK